MFPLVVFDFFLGVFSSSLVDRFSFLRESSFTNGRETSGCIGTNGLKKTPLRVIEGRSWVG